MDTKVPLPPAGGMQGLQCSECQRTFYASSPGQLNKVFDTHVCDKPVTKK
jgi:hypothetical protein